MLLILAVYLTAGAALGACEVSKLHSASLSCRLSLIAVMALFGVPAMIGELIFAEKHKP